MGIFSNEKNHGIRAVPMYFSYVEISILIKKYNESRNSAFFPCEKIDFYEPRSGRSFFFILYEIPRYSNIEII